MTRKLTPPHRRWSHGDRRRGAAGRSGSPWDGPSRSQARRSRAQRNEFRSPIAAPSGGRQLQSVILADVTSAVGTSGTAITARVHSLNRPNMVSVGTIVWLSSELMFFAGLFAFYFTARAQAAGHRPPSPHRAEPVPGGAGHAGADRLVVHLPDGGFRSRARRRVRAAPL